MVRKRLTSKKNILFASLSLQVQHRESSIIGSIHYHRRISAIDSERIDSSMVY